MADRSNVDVLVVGAGMAGVCAAIAAARHGARTVLTDRYAFLGGNATAGLLGNFLTFHNMKGEQICNGIPQEIVDDLIRLGGAFPEGHLHNAYGNSYSVTPQDGEVLKLVNQKLCLDAGVDLVLNTYTIGPVMDGDRVAGARIVNKSGESEIPRANRHRRERGRGHRRAGGRALPPRERRGADDVHQPFFPDGERGPGPAYPACQGQPA